MAAIFALNQTSLVRPTSRKPNARARVVAKVAAPEAVGKFQFKKAISIFL